MLLVAAEFAEVFPRIDVRFIVIGGSLRRTSHATVGTQ